MIIKYQTQNVNTDLRKNSEKTKRKLSQNTKKVKHWLETGLTKYRIAKMMSVSPTTVSNFIKRMGW